MYTIFHSRPLLSKYIRFNEELSQLVNLKDLIIYPNVINISIWMIYVLRLYGTSVYMNFQISQYLTTKNILEIFGMVKKFKLQVWFEVPTDPFLMLRMVNMVIYNISINFPFFILSILQSVIRFSGSPHRDFPIPYHYSLKPMT